jgi:hypothetical protein
MKKDEIPMIRLANQQLLDTTIRSPAQMVAHFGAIQAQDFHMSKWALGIRLGSSEDAIGLAIDNGEIIRTHLMRPTWHLVAAEDVRWLLQLTGPQVKRQFMSMARKMGYDEKAFNRCNKTIEKALSKQSDLTREELMAALKIVSTGANDFRPAFIMMNAEQDGIVCNGKMKGKQFTYALLNEKVAPAAPLSTDEALPKLAIKYFSSHGPATQEDFSWWSGLGVVRSKLAIESISKTLRSAIIEGQKYYYFDPETQISKTTTHLLPAFDELLISYKDRTASIELEHQSKAFTKNGIFKPVIAVSGKIAGTWKRTQTKSTIQIDASLFEKRTIIDSAELTKAAKRYGAYHSLPISIDIGN